MSMPRTTTALTPLHWRRLNGHKDVAELLLANKADVNAKDNDGETPLHMAAFKGHKDVAELLLANKADVNAKDNDGCDAFALCGGEGTQGRGGIAAPAWRPRIKLHEGEGVMKK